MLELILSIGTLVVAIGGFRVHHLLGVLEVSLTYSSQQVLHVCTENFYNWLLGWPLVVGGTESLGITAGETKNPSRTMPRVVKLVFWRYSNIVPPEQ